MIRNITLRRFNNLLSLAVIGLALYVIVWPIWPQIAWWLKNDAPLVSSAPPNVLSEDEAIPDENTLVIPKINLRDTILEGESTATVDNGLWRRPRSIVPPAEGNMVIVGHRFSFRGQNHFYHLDKLALDDPMRVYWDGEAYDYRVAEIKVVPATEVSVEQPFDRRMLTLYTCTPLWSAKDRLVIVALPSEDDRPLSNNDTVPSGASSLSEPMPYSPFWDQLAKGLII